MATTQTASFSDLLRRYRRAAGLTQEELAEQAGVSRRLISDLERGLKHRPRKDTIELLSTALQLSSDERTQFETAARRLGRENPGIVRPERAPLPTGNYLGAQPAGPLVARDDELRRLEFALDTVEAGAGQFVLLAGEPGVGKTRLAQQASRRAWDRGFVVAIGRCYERAQAVLLYPFTDALRTIATAASAELRSEIPRRWPVLEHLLPEHVGAPAGAFPASAQEELDLVRAVTSLLAAESSAGPIALLLDDLHWADEMSLGLLQHLAYHTRAYRVLLLGTYRDTDLEKDHPLRRTIQALTREHLVERISLGRLSVEETAALVAATVGETEGVSEFAEFVHRRTKGNPFFIDTLLHALGGHYRLVREIGAGGMGRVFEAVDVRTGERVAAKIMFSRSDADLHALRRFEQEGAVLATLEDEHIVKVLGTFIEEHSSCIIMELLEGQSLGQMMREREDQGGPAERLTLARIKRLSTQVAAALAYAHGRHIVHRDIKPDNVMVVGNDVVKVTDFGIARMLRPAVTLQSVTSTGLTLGTPLYMAPEQIEGKPIDGRADLYSLGAMLYHLVAGRPIFQGDDPLAIAYQHVHETPVPPRSVKPSLPPDWEALMMKALAKDPADRFQTAEAMKRAIAALSEAEQPDDPLGDDTPIPREEVARIAGVLSKPALPHVSGRRLVAGAIGVTVLIGVAVLLLMHVRGSSGPQSGPVKLTDQQPIATFGTSPLAPADELLAPSALAVDRHGNLYIADVGHSRIEVLSPHGRVVTQWGTQGSGPGQFENPVGVALDRQGDVYVTDFGNFNVQKFSSSGKLLAGQGPRYPASPRAPGALQSEIFSWARGVAVDTHGNVFVTDAGDQCVAVLSSTLVLQGCWGTAGNGPNEWAEPRGVAVDATGHAYIADSGNYRIVRLSPPATYWSPSYSPRRLPILPSFQFLQTWGIHGNSLGDFAFPVGIAVDRQNNIFVVDSDTSRVQEFSPTGRLLAAWGREGAKPGEFRNPQGIAVDAEGHVYVADTGNNRIQEFATG